MQRERMTGGGATMNEAFNEVAGEGYGEARINNNGFETRGILTPEEFGEYNKLDTDGQLEYLKNMDEKELDGSLLNIYYFLDNICKNDSSDTNTDILNLLNRKTIKNKNILFKNMIDIKFAYSGTDDLKSTVNYIREEIESRIKENN